MKSLSRRLDHFDSTDFQVAMKAARSAPGVIDLSIGIPEDDTAEHIKQAGIEAIISNRTTYPPAAGILELRQAIAKDLNDSNNIKVSAQQVTIVPGLTIGQLLVYLALLDPGDEIIIFDPYYPPYPHLASMIGACPVIVPTNTNFQPDIAVLEANITQKTKALIVNSPNNPSGAVYSEETLRQIASIAEKHDIFVISDEIYRRFCYDSPHFSIGSIYENTLTLNGFSKEYAMTGWRLGYIAGPQNVIDGINELQQYAVMGSSSISAYAAISALSRKPDGIQKYKEKRDYVLRVFKEMNVDIKGANGAFYIFFQAPAGMTGQAFVKRASELGLILVPGRAFSQVESYVRLSYGAPYDSLEQGMRIIKMVFDEQTSGVIE